MTEKQQQLNILVCDDDKEIAGAIEIYLRNEGYHVFKAFDGFQALETAGSLTVNLKKAAESFEIALFFCQEICFII